MGSLTLSLRTEKVAGSSPAERANEIPANRGTFKQPCCLYSSSESELEQLDQYVKDNSDLWLATGHPQGSNVMSRNRAKGVVDPSFCVHGFENLYVWDASVFPCSIEVNPQLTVMALANYAAQLVKERSS
jgi:choline dehydrogenase-like flavoprotein